jgi:predicted nuclease of restriction endonuclease-like (RecB) superfamily
MIALMQEAAGWGASVIPRLAGDLKNELPAEKGFSQRNLGNMVRFFKEYGAPPILQQAAAKLNSSEIAGTSDAVSDTQIPRPASASPEAEQLERLRQAILLIPWYHNVILLQKFAARSVRLWYAEQILQHGWSRDVLALQIKSAAHTRQGKAVCNFDRHLPPVHAELASGLLKDPYLFDFLTIEEPFHERELETGLLRHIEKFLLELGRGFAFVGRQYRLEVSEREFYLDLLFYHLQLRCFVVVDLKKGEFKPEYAGKMNFYCSVVDDQLRHAHDAPTIGLVLCQTKDRVIAEYSLRDIEKPIGVADYELTRSLPASFASSLPSIEDLEAELSRESDSEVEMPARE